MFSNEMLAIGVGIHKLHFNMVNREDPNLTRKGLSNKIKIELVHEISNNVVCATSKASDQPAHTHSLIRTFASPLSIL